MTAAYANFDHLVGRTVTGPVYGSERNGVSVIGTGVVLGYQFRAEVFGTMFLVLLPDGSVVLMAAARIQNLEWPRDRAAREQGAA
jgi:hypothetical protein